MNYLNDTIQATPSRQIAVGIVAILATLSMGVVFAFATGFVTPEKAEAFIVTPPCCVPPPPPPPPPPP
ncbi:MAG: hypothetical protein KBC38_03335, partial [Candidatus Pacebacteria bacterium]|nr:hypothetical protein [Candidatus Paceibacterota bacterium]MBP9840790.1 hypothetical protein [Candidatus Paceibacterota bacterium]